MADDLSAPNLESRFLAFSPAELEISAAAQSVLGGLVPIARLHKPGGADLSESLRRQLAKLGWFGLAVSEDQGGSGFSTVEYALFFREVGRLCGPIDILSQTLGVLATDDEDLRGSLMSGAQEVALAIRDGDVLRVLGAPGSQLAVAVEPGHAQIISLAGFDLSSRSSLDPGTTLRVASGESTQRPDASVSRQVWEMGQLGTAAMLVGIAEASLDLIVEYAKVRETFGRKIGSYQAVRHPCADMALRLEAARCQLWYAAASLKEAKRDAPAHLAAAKHLANQAALINADVSIQLHGGIGLTDEHHAHLLLKRALMLNLVFGSKRSLLAEILHTTVED